MKCEYPNCKKEAEFALYWLKVGRTKQWVNLCNEHDRIVAIDSRRLRLRNPDRIFKEV